MLVEEQENWAAKNLQELQDFISNTRDVREWKRAEAVKLRLRGFSYREIEERLEVSTSFIAQTQRKFLIYGIRGLKLGYRGSKGYLTSEQKIEIMSWLNQPKNRNLSELERHLIETYDVLFKSPQSYYQILNEGHLTWQKANRENPKKKPELIAQRNQEIAKILEKVRPEIEAGLLVVYALDECHLQGDDICNYLWGNSQEREIVLVSNERDRQTYYGALNLLNQEFIVSPYSAGNGENTVKFIEELKKRNPQKKLLLIWDGASYHRGEIMQELLIRDNFGKEPEDWSITCCLFAPYAPEENPVESVWLQVKSFIRRFHYICNSFSIVKKIFQFFFKFQLFNRPNLKKYDAFAQLI